MIDGIVYDAIVEGIRTLFVVCVPIVAAVAVAGFVMSIIQSATTITDPALSYAVRLAAFGAVAYVLLSSFIQTIYSLTESVLR